MPLEVLGLEDSFFFSAETNDFGSVMVRDLATNGQNISVTGTHTPSHALTPSQAFSRLFMPFYGLTCTILLICPLIIS